MTSHLVYQNNATKKAVATALVIIAASAADCLAAETEADHDKSGYTLFNPTPTDLMRDLNTDRPNKTESPYTVDAGHYQIESDIFTFTHDHDTANGADSRVDSWSFATLDLRAGLCNRAEFQLILDPYSTVRTEDRHTKTVTHQRGFGDTLLRLKVNVWGDDGGKTAFGLIPFIKVPSNQDGLGNDAVEGGLIFPFAAELPGGWGLGAMTEFDGNQDGEGGGYHTEFVNSVTFDHDIIGKLSGYLEFFSQVSTESGSAWIGTFDLGLEYQITRNIQIDGGVNLGLTKSADDWNPFAGISIRF